MNTYAFFTTKGFRIDAKGKTPEEAYNSVNKPNETQEIWVGTLTKDYIIYDEDGLSSVYAPTYRLK